MWLLDPSIDQLNHGSFGATPLPVLQAQDRLRRRLEANPTEFLTVSALPLLASAREAAAAFVGADTEGFVFVSNATTGVNAVLQSMAPSLGRGDVLVTTDHAYNACRNVLDSHASRAGARVRTVALPFPIDSPQQAADLILGGIDSHTKLLLVDHVTSPSGLILPVERLVAELEPDIAVLVDGAHAAGMVPLGIVELGASYYAGNFHKWVCAPKGTGFLWARPDRREDVVPPVVSHGWNSPVSGNRLHDLFDWMGTVDPTPHLTVPDALETMGGAHADGWDGLMKANHDLAVKARDVLCDALATAPPAPDEMLGSMAAVPLPPGVGPDPGIVDPLTNVLRDVHHIEVPVFSFPRWPERVVRVSAQVYNRVEQYLRLADVLGKITG